MRKKILIKNGKALIGEDGKILSSSTIGSDNTGLPIEISSKEEMEMLLTFENIDKIYKYIGETNETFTNGNLYQVMEVDE